MEYPPTGGFTRAGLIVQGEMGGAAAFGNPANRYQYAVTI
jgi:hypothetical protein